MYLILEQDFLTITTADQAYHKTFYEASVVFYFIRAILIHRDARQLQGPKK